MLLNNIYNLLLKGMFTTKGRANRKEYVVRILSTFIVFVIAGYTANDIVHYNILLLIYIWFLVLCMSISLIQYFPLSIRRLHDLNTSGWYVFLTFVPFCQFFILWLMFKEGTEGANRYGEQPKN
mgnify:CR=1 FL=1